MISYYRSDYSGYFSQQFERLETEALEKVPGLQKAEDINNANVIISNSETYPESLPADIELVIHPNSGYDQFKKNWLQFRDIPVIVGSSIRLHAVGEYYMSCIFKHFSPIPKHESWDKERQWERPLINELKVLILGLGHIGSYMKDTLGHMAKEVLVHDPSLGYEFDFEKLGEIDIVISCFGLNESTKNFFNDDFFSRCKEDLLLLHAARGKQVIIADLIKFLSKNKEAFCYLDVFPKEPFTLENLNLKNLWTTSHIAGVWQNIEKKVIAFEKEVLQDYIELGMKDFLLKYKSQNLNERSEENFLK